MFNANKPSESDLPSSGQLLRSTVVALIAALVILVTIVLPAEYAIDPTGVGRLLQLTKMGKIKQQLSAEVNSGVPAPRVLPEEPRMQSPVAQGTQVLSQAEPPTVSTNLPPAKPPTKSDEVSITLQPNEGVEYKMTMAEQAQVQYSWRVLGGVVNYDMHGTAPGGASEVSYKMEREVSGDEGTLTAGFDGKHGWFWRNRGVSEVSITLRTSGAYDQLSRVK